MKTLARKLLDGLPSLAFAIVLMLLFEIATAQTKIPPSSLSSRGLTGKVLVVDGNGNVTFANLDGSLVIDSTGPVPIIRVAAATETVDITTAPAPAGTFALSRTPTDPASVQFHRNGMLLSPVIDFNVSGALVTLVAAQALQPGDVVHVRYR